MNRIFGGLVQEYREFDAVDSTNRYALDAGIVGLLVTARSQTRGRGTKGRTWFSPHDTNLYLTVTLGEPDQRFSIITGVAVHDCLSELCRGIEVEIKWPNDIMISGKKVCGILCESKGALTAIGIGINVRQTAWPDDLIETATSLSAATGMEYEVPQVMRQVLNRMDQWFHTFYENGFQPVRQRFLEHGLLKGHRIRTEEGLDCTIVDLDMEGRLLINVSGKLKTLVSGSLFLER